MSDSAGRSPGGRRFPDPLIRLLESDLFEREGTDELFNPYLDRDSELCVEDAPRRRRDNLRAYLELFEFPPEFLLAGEAPSWRGMRFSGIPFTAEALLEDPDFPVDGSPTSRRERPLSEPSATILWGALQEHFPRFLLWNVVPFHPHPAGEPEANRTPRRSEVRSFAPLLHEVVERVGPGRILAVGRTAERSLGELGLECTYVRHPAQGGAPTFRRQVARIFG